LTHTMSHPSIFDSPPSSPLYSAYPRSPSPYPYLLHDDEASDSDATGVYPMPQQQPVVINLVSSDEEEEEESDGAESIDYAPRPQVQAPVIQPPAQAQVIQPPGGAAVPVQVLRRSIRRTIRRDFLAPYIHSDSTNLISDY